LKNKKVTLLLAVGLLLCNVLGAEVLKKSDFKAEENFWTALDKGDTYFMGGKYREALIAYQEASQSSLSNATKTTATESVAEVYAHLGRFEEAIENFRLALRVTRNNDQKNYFQTRIQDIKNRKEVSTLP
jgi:tetratricopeptide (TPR) repeat protein